MVGRIHLCPEKPEKPELGDAYVYEYDLFVFTKSGWLKIVDMTPADACRMMIEDFRATFGIRADSVGDEILIELLQRWTVYSPGDFEAALRLNS